MSVCVCGRVSRARAAREAARRAYSRALRLLRAGKGTRARFREAQRASVAYATALRDSKRIGMVACRSLPCRGLSAVRTALRAAFSLSSHIFARAVRRG